MNWKMTSINEELFVEEEELRSEGILGLPKFCGYVGTR